MKITRSHYLHLNVSARSRDRVHVNIPTQQQFKLNPGELQRLTLISAELQNAIYTVNETNRHFFWHDPTFNIYLDFALLAGVYADFADVATMIQGVLRLEHFPNATCVYNALQRNFVLETGATLNPAIHGAGAAPSADGFFVCFQLHVPAAPLMLYNGAVVPANQLHQDTHLLLGCAPNGNAFNALGQNQHISPLPPRLQTTDALLLRSPQQAVAFQTANMQGAGAVSLQQQMMSTDVVARLTVDPDAAMIVYEDDGGDRYQFYPHDLQHLDKLQFFLTDERGRAFDELLQNRARTAPLNLSLALRWDACVPDPRPPRPGVGPFTANYRTPLTEAETL